MGVPITPKFDQTPPEMVRHISVSHIKLKFDEFTHGVRSFARLVTLKGR